MRCIIVWLLVRLTWYWEVKITSLNGTTSYRSARGDAAGGADSPAHLDGFIAASDMSDVTCLTSALLLSKNPPADRDRDGQHHANDDGEPGFVLGKWYAADVHAEEAGNHVHRQCQYGEQG